MEENKNNNNNKIKDYIKIISFPVIFTLIVISVLVYNHFTGVIIKFIPNLYELIGMLMFINVFFAIINIRDYRNGKL